MGFVPLNQSYLLHLRLPPRGGECHVSKFVIDLTEEETKIFTTIEFDPGEIDFNNASKNGEAVLKLVGMLAKRDALPPVRAKFWTDPKYQIGRLKCSHKGVFERNGCTGAEIYKHPHFLPYLRYFLFGADLPLTVIAEFEKKVGNPRWVTSSDVVPLGAFARSLARKHSLNKHNAADEFFKLALDLGLSVNVASSIHHSVMQLK